MSVWNYVVTAQKPTSVTHSCVGNFTSPQELNLIVAYGSFPLFCRPYFFFLPTLCVKMLIWGFRVFSVHHGLISIIYSHCLYFES